MTNFNITNGSAFTFTDTTPDGGFVIDFARLDNSFNVTVNGVQLFIGGPAAAPNELEFQNISGPTRTVGFQSGGFYGTGGVSQIWQISGTTETPVVRLQVNPDGTIALYGARTSNGPLEPLQLINGLQVNTTGIANAWNANGDNTIVIDQRVTGQTYAGGEIEDIICFAAGTLIDTPQGPLAVEGLLVGDQVLTHDHGPQPIRWIGRIDLPAARLAAEPRLQPILIRADALGPGYPAQDLIVSPQHRILVASAIARRMFDRDEVLIPANKLTAIDGIDVLDTGADGVTYVHFLCDRHEIVRANGTLTESLFVGPETLRAVSEAGRAEIGALFPELLDPSCDPVAARHIPSKGKAMRKLALRHHANGKPLYSGMADR